jgi:hypothetical protein
MKLCSKDDIKMDKAVVIELLDAICDKVQNTRENGETDLRTILHFINDIKEIVENY